MNDGTFHNAPFIKPHIDGPMLVCRDGFFRWLSLSERFLVFIGASSAWELEKKEMARRRKQMKGQPA